MTDEWVETTLGEVAEINMGQQLSPERSAGNRLRAYLRAANVSPGHISSTDVNEMHFSSTEEERHQLRVGDVLLVEGGNEKSVGSPALVTEEVAGLCMQNTLLRLRVRDTGMLEPGFLLLSMMRLFSSGYFASLAKGTTIMHLGAKRVPAVPISLPPLPVQRRIVDLMANLDNHLANLQTERDAARQLWESLLCEPPFTQVDVALGDALERIEAGKSPAGEDRVPGADERGVLKVSAVGRNSFHPHEVKTVTSSTLLPDHSKVCLGDVLMVRANGVLDRVGQACQVPVQVSNLYLCDKTLRLVPKQSLDGTFLTGALLSPKAREQIVARTGGSHMRNISQSAIRQIRIPLPPHDEQSRIGHLFQSISDRESLLEHEIEACLSYRVALLGSLLRARVSIPDAYDSLLSEVA